jgi:hypothetical protein
VAEGVDEVQAVMQLTQGQHVQVELVTPTETSTLAQHPDVIAYFSGFLIHQ